ncbi:MAG TPA: MlaD family protein [Bacteroidia bacterium]|nr:MCE family protein [Bacteroidota bacterium]MBK7430485.1 MCE family protein [Bacteroidota bacterium]MBK7573134.1 MCE family protein [Bacteroidota bacterium]HQW22202.1 MlaD family protein [Bacteroidia bacterium]
MKFSREIRTGLIMVVGIAVLFWGVNYLKGNDFFTRQRTVFAVYDQVEGLTSTNPVMVNGMKVGMIHQLTLQPNGQIIVSMHVTNKVIVPRNSTAEIFSTDLLGSKGIRLVFGDSKEDLVDGDTMTAGVQQTLSEQVNAQVAPIKAKAESLLSSIDSILLTVRAVFNENTKNNLKRSFESISNSLASIENVAGSLDTVLAKQGRLRVIFDNIESITTNMKNNNENLTKIITNFSAITDTIAKSKLAETLDRTSKTMAETSALMERVNRGEGSLGQLATNDSLYTNLNSSAHSLDELLKDFQANPRKYLKVSVISFGK